MNRRKYQQQYPPASDPLDYLDDSGSDPGTIEVVRNHIYFYTDVQSGSIKVLTSKLQTLDAELRKQTVDLPYDPVNEPPICLHIHSYGGEVFAGLAAVDAIATLRCPVYTYAEGICASAATLLLMAGKQRFITPHTFLLIHQFTSGWYGTYASFQDEMKLQDKLMERLVRFYVERTSLEEGRLRDLLQHDYWMDAEEAVALGFGQLGSST